MSIGVQLLDRAIWCITSLPIYVINGSLLQKCSSEFGADYFYITGHVLCASSISVATNLPHPVTLSSCCQVINKTLRATLFDVLMYTV